MLLFDFAFELGVATLEATSWAKFFLSMTFSLKFKPLSFFGFHFSGRGVRGMSSPYNCSCSDFVRLGDLVLPLNSSEPRSTLMFLEFYPESGPTEIFFGVASISGSVKLFSVY